MVWNACSTGEIAGPAPQPGPGLSRQTAIPVSVSSRMPTARALAREPSREGTPSVRRDDAPVNLAQVRVKAAELAAYCLSHVYPANTLILRDYRDAPWEDAGRSIIWAEAGYWGCAIVAIDGVDVATLGQREWYRMLFYGSDPVRLSVAAHSKQVVVIDAFTGKGPRPARSAEPTPATAGSRE